MSPKNSIAKKLDKLKQAALDLRQEEGFVVAYSDHVAVLDTGFDLRVTFGRVDPATGPNVVLQHNAVVLPWPAVKTLIYLLQQALLTYEEANGHVPYPKGGIMPPVTSVPEEVIKSFPKAKDIHEKVWKLWAEFLAANPEAAPLETGRK